MKKGSLICGTSEKRNKWENLSLVFIAESVLPKVKTARDLRTVNAAAQELHGFIQLGWGCPHHVSRVSENGYRKRVKMASNIWADIRKASKESRNNGGNKNPWANLPIFEGEPPIDVPLPKVYVPVISNNELPEGSICLDIETGSAANMWKTGPEFLRLFGYSIDDYPVCNYETPEYMIHDIMARDGWVITHNGNNFDSILLDKHHGVSILQLAKEERLRDTKLIAFLADPPYSRMKEGEIEKMYSLQTVGTKYLGEGKMVDVATGQSVLKRLAAEFGGFDKIPLDHPEYNEYLKRDVEVTRDLVKVLPMNDYVIREHKIAAVAATISIQGFRVDLELLDQRIREGEEKRFEILTQLQGYGLPGPETTKAPQMTKLGKEAIDLAFRKAGINLPRTASGKPALGKEVLQEIVASAEKQEAIDLAEAVMGLNGVRTIYGNIFDNLVGDKVHPSINIRQSTGRFSFQNPGLSVIGKRGGKVIERAVFLPDNEDHVLISADLAQIDARAIAGLCQDTEYLKLFEEGRDLHAEMSLRLFGTEAKREEAKACSHGISYSMQSKKLSLTTGLSLFEAEDVIRNFEHSFPRLVQWRDEQRETGEATGILYNGFGRMMRVEPGRAFTQASAMQGQSSARDLLCEGILNLWQVGGEDIIRMIRGIIHDELVLSVNKKDVEEVERLVIKAMSFPWCPEGGTHEVQILAGLNKRGVNWADAYRK